MTGAPKRSTPPSCSFPGFWQGFWRGLLCLTLSSCSGLIESPNGPDSRDEDATASSVPSPLCSADTLAAQPLRRLSSSQYRHTVIDLFGAELATPLLEGTLFPNTQIKAGFQGDAEANTVNTAESNAIEDNAERIARLINEAPLPYLKALMPCSLPDSPSDGDVDGCIDSFISQFGERAYRRPLTDSERSIVRGLYDEVRKSQSGVLAWSATLQFFVQSPALLYRVERGSGEAKDGLIALSSYELAARLSFLLTDSMPDAELFDAAKNGKLRTQGEIAAQAERLMKSPRFLAVLEGFHRDWLHLYELKSKDPAVFPEFDDTLKAALDREAGAYVRYVFEQGDGSLEALLSGTTFPFDPDLSQIYGENDKVSTTEGMVERPDRRGLLTSASFMAATSKPDRTSPIHRGAFFLREVLCRDLPSLPGNVDINGPLESTATLPTARERLAPLLEDKVCSGCHRAFNPTGLAFEQYDALGRFRSEEGNTTIDAAGSLDLGQGAVEFADARELVDNVASSEMVRSCYERKWYQAALGRREVAEDACALENLRSVTSENPGDVRALLLALIQTDAFLFRRTGEE